VVKKIMVGILSIFTATLLWAAVGRGAESYTVKKGDTLSGIAQIQLGDMRKWEDLAEWNELETEWKEGMAYVWIKPGQEIRLTPPKKDLSPQEIHQYVLNTKKSLEREIFRMAGIKNPSSRWELVKELNVTVIVKDAVSIRRTIQRLQRWLEELEIQSRYWMVDEILAESFWNKSLYKFFPDAPYWVQHRKICLLLVALLDIESNGYFDKSHKGALGPYQFLPSTYTLTTGDERDPKRVLMENSQVALEAAMKYLALREDLREALARYHGHPGGWIYADKILAAYNQMLGRTELLDERED